MKLELLSDLVFALRWTLLMGNTRPGCFLRGLKFSGKRIRGLKILGENLRGLKYVSKFDQSFQNLHFPGSYRSKYRKNRYDFRSQKCRLDKKVTNSEIP